MSYLDPPGGHNSSDDWSSTTGGDGRDERFRARHTGAAPDPYADDRLPAGGPGGPPPYGYGVPSEAPDPYAAYRRGGDPAASPGTGPARGEDQSVPYRNGPGAYPGETGRIDGPAWDSPTAATSTSQAEFELASLAAPGRRRAGRGGSTAEVAAAPTGRAGRNLRAAIVVGCSLGALVLAALFVWPPAFPAVVLGAASVGIWEMVRALRSGGANPPLIPLLGGGLVMLGSAWYAGTDGLTLGLLVTLGAATLWRIGDGLADLRRDITAIVLVAAYVPFLLGFGVLLMESDDGAFRVLATLLAVVLSDTGGYAAGVFLSKGKHPMAPKISPKKSWEGFGGSVAAASLGSALVFFLTLDVPFYWGALFGVVIAVVAVLGDLTESMMKRDLGIKDMSQLLPGHGGLMDRLDSILFAVPTAYVMLALVTSWG